MFEAVVDFVTNNPFTVLVIVFIVGRFLFRGSPGEIEEFPGHKVISIKSMEEWKEALATASKEKKLVIADFYAVWCGPCRYAAPVYGKMSTEFEDVVFLKVDVDNVRDVTLENSVRAMPTFVLYKNESLMVRVTGWNERNIRNLLQKHRK